MRNILLACALTFCGTTSHAQELPTIMELRAVEINYFGGITGFDQNGYTALRTAIGGLIANETIAQFRTTARGMEGGATFCVELNDDTRLKINAITDVLETIKPSAITVYNHNLLKSCDQ